MTKKILIVDDDEFYRSLLVKALDAFGFEAVTVNNGYEAMKICENHLFDLIITDIFMPDMDGLELIKNISSRKTPILVISGANAVGVDYLKTAMMFGASDVLYKPIEFDILQEKIDRLISQ